MKNYKNVTNLYPWFEDTEKNNEVQCKLCNAKFVKTKFNLQRHTKRFHEGMLGSNQDLKNEEPTHKDFKRTATITVSNSDNIIEKEIENTTKSYIEKATYKVEWNSLPEYAAYIRPSQSNENKVLCTACKYDIVASTTVINNHLNSTMHLLATNQIEKPKSEESTLISELRYTAMIVDRNVSFLFGEKLLAFLKDLLPDSDLLAKMNMDRKKLTSVVQCVLAPAQKSRIAEILKDTSFSICIDESTDISKISSICIVVRYPDNDRQKICDSLWDIIPAYRRGDEKERVDAEYVYDAVINTFVEANIPLNNIVAFCSDTCNLMMGRSNSVASRFKTLNPNIAIIKCSCHLEHLISRDATNVFRPECLELNSLIYNYICSSSKRTNSWLTLQQKLGISELMILKPVATRWLSQYSSVLRVLRRWSALTKFFENECNEAKSGRQQKSDSQSECNELNSVENILNCLKDPFMQACFLFLEHALSKLTKLNETLQHERPMVPETNSRLTDLYIDFLKMYMVEDYIEQTEIHKINPEDQSQFKNLEDIDIGFKTTQFLNQQEDDINDFQKVCQTFYVECCKGIHKRYNVANTHDKRFFFHPNNVLSGDFHQQYPILMEAYKAVSQVTVVQNEEMQKKINMEWENIVSYDFSNDVAVKIQNAKHADDFWYVVKQVHDIQGRVIFPNLATFALSVLCIPHSNAAPERVWSKLNLEKTKLRNELSFATTRAILLASQYVKDEGGIMNFMPTDFMIERMEVLRRYKGIRSSVRLPVDNDEYYGTIHLCEDLKRKCAQDEILFCGKYAKNYSDNFINLYSLDENCEKKVNLQGLEENIYQSKKQNMSNNSITHNTIADISNDLVYIDERQDKIFNLKLDDEIKQINTKNLNSDTAELVPLRIIMNNCLISDYNYYYRANDFRTIGIYKRDYDHPIKEYREFDTPTTYRISQSEVALFAAEYKSLNDSNFIDGDVIDAFGAVKERMWINTFAISTQHTSILLDVIGKTEIDSNWFMFHLKGKFQGKILLPYETNKHWCLFIVDINQGILTHIDPMKIESKNKNSMRAKKCIKNFLKYTRESKKYTENNLQEIKWVYKPHTDCNRPVQKDTFNCGMYVMYYMDCIGSAREFELTFNPNEYRKEIAQLLISKSEPMQDICMYCFSKQKNNIKLICKF